MPGTLEIDLCKLFVNKWFKANCVKTLLQSVGENMILELLQLMYVKPKNLTLVFLGLFKSILLSVQDLSLEKVFEYHQKTNFKEATLTLWKTILVA